MRKIMLFVAIAAGMCHAAVTPLDQATLKEYLTRGAPFDFILIDVRTPEEVTAAIGSETCKPYNLPWPDPFMQEVAKIPKDQAIVVYCRSGSRSSRAAAYLSDNGYTRVYDAGGFLTWSGPTVSASDAKPASLLPAPQCTRPAKAAAAGGTTHVQKN